MYYIFRNLTELQIHHAEGHLADESISSISEDDLSLEDLGITKLPIVGKRRKHNFDDLQIDTDGVIEVDDDLEKDNDEILIMSDDESDTLITTEETIKEKEVNRKKKGKVQCYCCTFKTKQNCCQTWNTFKL